MEGGVCFVFYIFLICKHRDSWRCPGEEWGAGCCEACKGRIRPLAAEVGPPAVGPSFHRPPAQWAASQGAFSSAPQSSPLCWLGEGRGQPRVTGQVVFAGKPPVVERVHVDDGISLHHEGRLGFVLRALLAGEGQPNLLSHGAAEGPLEAERPEEEDVRVRAWLIQR